MERVTADFKELLARLLAEASNPHALMITAQLKYQQELAGNPCSLDKFKEYTKRTAYRWTFEDINDPRNFLPKYMLDRERLERDQKKGQYSCTCWAISFFESKKQAKDRLESLMNMNPRIYKKLGTHAAKGLLVKEDGISEECDKDGHFNHFEYCNISLSTKFVIEERIVAIENA